MKDFLKGFCCLILFFAAGATLQSCDQEEPEIDTSDFDLYGASIWDVIDNPSVYHYWHYLYVTFEDESGKNPIDAVKTYSDLHRCEILELSLDIEEQDRQGYKYCDVVSLDDNKSYIDLTWDARLYETTGTVTRKITCEGLFGDDAEHVIVCNYLMLPKIKSITVPMKLWSFTIDGKKFEVREGNRVTVKLPLQSD